MADDYCASTCGSDAAPDHALDLHGDAANFDVSLAVGGAQVFRQPRTPSRAEAKKAVPAP